RICTALIVFVFAAEDRIRDFHVTGVQTCALPIYELVENLGTIARSGTRAFLDAVASGTGSEAGDLALIGQFGVGFYSAFMVADRVEVLSRKAGESQGWRWESDGKGSYSVAQADGVPRGTRVVVHLAANEDEFLDETRLRHIVTTHSDHLALPIVLETKDGEQMLNRASALWTRPKSEVTPEQYKEFYH